MFLEIELTYKRKYIRYTCNNSGSETLKQHGEFCIYVMNLDEDDENYFGMTSEGCIEAFGIFAEKAFEFFKNR